MRNFLTKSLFVLALVVGAAGAAPAAHAQPSGTPTAEEQAIIDRDSDFSSDDYGPAQSYGTSYETTPEYKAAAQTPTGGNLGPSTPTDYSFNGIMGFIASLFAWLLGVAAITLDNAVYYTVVTMGDYVHSLTAVGIAWRVLRDIANIMLIFGFIGGGIATILNVDIYGWKTKMLPMLLVAAVFVNFSLFITEAMIDTTNLFATQFYTQINGGTPAQPTGYIGSGQIKNEAISNKIMDQLGLQTIYGKAIDAKSAQAMFESSALIGFMSIILFLVAAFVFFSLAFILIARFVALIFFIILCPVGFMGLAIPQMQYRAGQWWKNFLEQIVTAPILLLLLYIAILVITDAKFLVGTGSDYTGLFTGNITGFATMILSFLIAMGLLLVVVIKAKSMSAFGAAGATKLAGKLSFGATAFVGRRTVGRVSNLASRAIRSSPLGATTYGRVLANVADKGAKASFDVRGIKAGGGLGALGGIDAGKAQEGGHRGTVERAAKARDDYAKTLSANQEAQRDAHRYQAWNLQQQNPALAQVAPLQRQYHAAMAQGQLAQAAQIQNQINAIAAQAQIPQNLLAQLDTAIQGDIQTTQTIQNMQVRYADSLNNWWSQNIPTTGSAARNEAARQVRSRLTTTPQQRLLNQLQAALNPPPAASVNQPPANQPPAGGGHP